MFALGLIAWKTGMVTETAYAIPIVPGNGAASAGSLGDVLKDLMSKIAMINTFMHVLLLIILQFLQYLLQADFFNNPNMMNGLFTIWKLCRDIMNIIFALALIAVSFYTIITAKSDMIRDKMAQFVIAVILVNFSWFFPRVIIDVANVLTSAIYSVPNLLPPPLNTCTSLGPTGNPVPCKVVTAVLLLPDSQVEMDQFCNSNAGTAANSPSCPCISDLECHVLQDYATALATMKPMHSMINGMAVSFVRITELATIPPNLNAAPVGTANAVKTSLRIGLSIMMAMLVQLAIVLPLIGMAVGFLIRIIILWVGAAFMPFSFLGYMVNGKLGTTVFGFEVDIWKEFVAAAFLPATVGAPFVIGFIMLTTVSNVPAPGNMPFDIGVPMISNITSWWAMLWMFAAIGIIWKGSFSALKKSEFIGQFTEKIRGFGEYVAGGVAQLPLITPLPIPGLKGGNLGTVVNSPRLFSDAVRASASGVSGKSFSDNLKDRLGINRGAGNGPGGLETEKLARDIKADTANQTKSLVDAINKLSTDRAGGINEIRNILSKMPNGRSAAGLSDSDTLRAMLEVANHKESAGSAISTQDIRDKIGEALKKP